MANARDPGLGNLVLAVDPGRDKCGVALVTPDGEAIERAIVRPEELPALVERWGARELLAIVGRGTGHQRAVEILREAGQSRIVLADEGNSTLIARRLYWEASPPRGWRKLVPRGMLLPPVPVDDWAAVALARAYLSGASSHRGA